MRQSGTTKKDETLSAGVPKAIVSKNYKGKQTRKKKNSQGPNRDQNEKEKKKYEGDMCIRRPMQVDK